MAAWLVLGWAVLASVASVVLERGNGAATMNAAQPEDWAVASVLLVLAAAGLVVVQGRRAVRAGWLLLFMGAGTSSAFLAHAVAVAALVRGHDGLGVAALVWLATWLFVPTIAVLPFVPALWPGNSVSSGWLRVPTMMAITAVAALTVAQAFAPDHLDGVGQGLGAVANPLGVPGLGPILDGLTAVGSVGLATYTVAVLVDLVQRYRRGSAALRRDLRPLVMVLAGLPVVLAAGTGMAAVQGGQLVAGLVAAGGASLLLGLAFTLVRADRAVRRGEQASAARRRAVENAAGQRRALRRDLHDGLGPGLAAIGLQLDAVRRALPATAAEAGSRLTRVEATLAAALEELRCIVDGLRPAALDDLGLRGALVSQGQMVSIPGGTTPFVDVRVDPGLPQMPDAVEVAIVRVSGEALTNAVRHGAPTRCTVRLAWRDGQAVLEVEDDGTGMDPGNPGHGLETMRERVEELGGTLTVSPRSPRGTVVSARIPAQQ